jgi:hypothetical protein
MKKLITILLLATFISCSKEEPPITECKCWEVEIVRVLEVDNWFVITKGYHSQCSDYYFEEEVDLILYYGLHCFNYPIKYEL